MTVVRDGNFVGVTAPSQGVGSEGRRSDSRRMEDDPAPSAKEIFDYLKNNASDEGGRGGRPDFERGSIAEGMAAADQKIGRKYTVAYIAHAPLEPRAAVAEWNEGKLTVWTGTQRPFGVRNELANAFRIPESGFASSSPTPDRPTAGSIPARPRSKQRGWRRPRGSR